MGENKRAVSQLPATIPQIEVDLPPCFSATISVERNTARQLLRPRERATLSPTIQPPLLRRLTGETVALVAGPAKLKPGDLALRVGREGLRHPAAAFQQSDRLSWIGDLNPIPPVLVTASWPGTFSFALGDQRSQRPGLRLPQLGAVHAVLAHWTTGSTQPATVVMPTGTGKTETMIGLLVNAGIERLLVVVPSDVLRTQLATKFETLGVLQESSVIDPGALRPVVGQIKHAFKTPGLATQFALGCNVLVTTPQALFAAPAPALDALLASCTHLFVDEAHHVEATTWRMIRDAFKGKPVVQFTATPFREDGRRIVGAITYAFPLREAQRLEYFSRINYRPIVDLANPDLAIATAAIAQLRLDLDAGYDHLLLARTNRIGRAQEVREVYQAIAEDLHPVVLHSSLPHRERKASLQAIRERRSRVIVCVDMLGEGSDLPSLKIAAMHDIHRSLGVTLQFVGRFARVAGAPIGAATVVAGRPLGPFDENLRKLYSEEPDWNSIINNLSEDAIAQERAMGAFEAEFHASPEDISLHNIEPRMSTVVYRTNCEAWNPHAIYDLYPEDILFTHPVPINERDHVAWFVIEARSPVRWGEINTLADVTYDLYAIYWDEAHQLLFVNSSNNESVHQALAEAVCGGNVELFKGEAVYRTMANVDRLVPTNVGVLDIRNRSRRFSLHVGADVIEGFPLAEAQTKTKTNIFAYGYEDGARVSIGASLKGRIWSFRAAASIRQWMGWCDHIGSKVSDDAIDLDEVMRGFIRPKVVDARPPYIPLALEWPWDLYLNTSDEVVVKTPNGQHPVVDTDLMITDHRADGPIPFNVSTPGGVFPYEISFEEGKIQYRAKNGDIEIASRHQSILLTEFFSKHGVTILCNEDVTIVHPGLLLKPERDLPPFDPQKLQPIDWTGVNIRKESQGPGRDPASVQARTILHVAEASHWDMIIDDDGTGEIADVVAMKAIDEKLLIDLTHCKFSHGSTPGARIIDLYEVCGQAGDIGIRRRRSSIHPGRDQRIPGG